jgi:ABC-type uncharacterized transport system substrate-binding protein
MVPDIMKRTLATILAAGLSLVLAASSAAAHPHVWVVAKSSVIYGPDGSVVGVRHSWVFDDMYSAFATQGLDQKTKGEFTREELESLAKENVESLKDFDFFTFAKLDGKKAVFTDPRDYYLEFNSKDTVLTLNFVLPLKSPVKAKSLSFEVFDPSYFVDFQFAEKDPLALDGAPAGCEVNLGKPQEMTKEMAMRLAEIPPDAQIPENSFGAAFANKILVKCP